MADKIVLNVGRYKGEYDLDAESEPFTNLEWRWIKKISGYLPLTVGDGLAGADPDVIVAFAVIALSRAGRIDQTQALQVADEFDSLPFDGVAIVYQPDLEETEAGDPTKPATTPATQPSPPSTGASSQPTLVPPANGPKRTGVPV